MALEEAVEGGLGLVFDRCQGNPSLRQDTHVGLWCARLESYHSPRSVMVKFCKHVLANEVTDLLQDHKGMVKICRADSATLTKCRERCSGYVFG